MPRLHPIPGIGLPALLLLILLLPACSDPGARLPPLPPGGTILAFGDSLTRGNGAGEDQSYPAVLARLSQRTVINAGVPGELSAQGLARLPELLSQHRPDLLLLCHGGNDMLRRFNQAITRDNLEAMITLATQHGIPVVLLGVPKPGLMFLAAADFYEELAMQHGLPYEGDIIASVESDSALKSDQIHPNAAGYQRIAEAVHALLQRSGALPPG